MNDTDYTLKINEGDRKKERIAIVWHRDIRMLQNDDIKRIKRLRFSVR